MNKSFYLVSSISIALLTTIDLSAQDMQLNIVNVTPTVKVGEDRGVITLDLCNVSGGTTNLAVNKARPLISFPDAIVGSVTLKSVNPVGGFTIVSNDGFNIRLNNAVTVAPGTCIVAELGFTAHTLGEAGTVGATIAWNGIPPVGEDPSNDNSATTINVRDAAAPVTLTSFTVDEFSNGNLLDWKIKDESGFSHFSVRKSTNLSEFWEIGTVPGGKKDGKFKFLDKNFNEGLNYYQLKMVDLDGSYKLSKIISIENRGEFGSTTIYPNPSPNRIFNLKNTEKFEEISLLSNEGVKYRVEVRNLGEKYEIKVPDSYAAGTYFLQFVGNDRVIRRKIILQ
ncbi:T9SS type A sorting domain-containing protein [Lacihabitans soyangensis]|uniref:T9SS C-terminal target domain-containing protein n=1 Tax=Lacihabitans soyangensis TaxID=869394 RepID=A0AAE3KWY2_9BACT|nr:T9SS type A sorting domain-containing protein [Lacihabitans soyangensis]MCP9763705.1 T9SS C-terminal target domain-containing protein [Lacihabitans soyangensis]